MIKVGIIGGAGYTAGELIRLLLNHPQAALVFVNSTSNAGNPLTDVHSGLLGETELHFTDQLPYDKIDVLFFCTAHGDTAKFMAANTVPAHLKIIDLSTDYRHKREGNDFIYGLPELNKESIKNSNKVANPGCFATAIQLALLPLACKGMLRSEIHVNAITGSTGAGVKPSSTTHFSWRDNNISTYNPFSHRHLKEIGESVTQLQNDFNQTINFIPIRGNFSRGIFVTTYLEFSETEEFAKKLYADFYKDAPFTVVSDKNPDMKQAVNTNKCIVYVEKCGSKLLIVSCIDNLLKGASGQAIENMNLMFGLEQTMGLKLKPSGF